MSMGMEVGIFLAYAMGMLLVYLTGKYLMVPVKWLARLMVNSVIGGVIIFAIDCLGANLNVFVPLNPVTAVIVGVLGLPGVLLLVAFFL